MAKETYSRIPAIWLISFSRGITALSSTSEALAPGYITLTIMVSISVGGKTSRRIFNPLITPMRTTTIMMTLTKNGLPVKYPNIFCIKNPPNWNKINDFLEIQESEASPFIRFPTKPTSQEGNSAAFSALPCLKYGIISKGSKEFQEFLDISNFPSS